MRTPCVAAIAALLPLACARHTEDIRPPPPPEMPGETAEDGSRESAGEARHEAPAPPRIFALTSIGDARSGSMIALAKRNGRTVAYVADEDDHALRAVDLEARVELGSTPLGGRPGQVLVTKQGRVVVALRDEARIAVYDAPEDADAPLVERARVMTAIEPLALATTPDGSRILVASAWGAKLEAFDAMSGQSVLSLDVPPEPRAVVVSGDGARAFVTHATAGTVTSIDLARASAESVDMGAKGRGPVTPMFKHIDIGAARGDFGGWGPSVAPRVSRQSFAMALLPSEPVDGVPQPDHVVVPHVLVDPGPSGVVTSGYGASVDADPQIFEIDVLDARTGRRTTQSMLEAALTQRSRSREGSCLLPRAAVADRRRRRVDVACLGADAVLEYPADWDANSLVAGAAKRRWSVGAGPVGLAIDPDRDELVAWSSFDRAITTIPLGSGGTAPTRITLPAKNAIPEQVAEGRRLFHAAGEPRMSRDGRACASCHHDGREDRLVWSTPEGPRQTPMLAGRIETGPYGWSGARPTIAAHLLQTVKNLKGTGLTDGERDALAAYLAWVPPPPARPAADPELAMRGRELFHSTEAACATCHRPDDGFTDHETHDVKSAVHADKQHELRTPSLRGLAGTAPYFHDGRYPTMFDLLRGSDGKMGGTKHLSDEQLAALEAYLETL